MGRRTQFPPPVLITTAAALVLLLVAPSHHDRAAAEAADATPSLDAVDLGALDARAVVSQIEELALLSDDPAPAVTRILFSKRDVQARNFVKDLMRKAGLAVREDAIGNIYGRLEGTDPSLPPVLSGSHTDAIPLSGKYDGVVGVLGAIEALRVLGASGCRFRHPIEAMMFTSEEPTRFGLSCIGSRALCGGLEAQRLEALVDADGGSFLSAIRGAGYAKPSGWGKPAPSVADVLESTRLPAESVAAFVELHIEQAPLLEQGGVDIGAVTAIAAPAAVSIDFVGNGGHAGALLMPFRKDAGLCAAELALAVEAAALGTKAPDTVATTGVLEIKPGAVNSVPREAHVGVDVRDIDGTRRDAVLDKILAAAETIASRRGASVNATVLNRDPPAGCAAHVVQAVREAAKSVGLSQMDMVSRAYHDALFMAQVAPTGMIFIPCRKGVSHRPDEFASEKDIGNGIKVLALTMAKLAGQECPASEESKESDAAGEREL